MLTPLTVANTMIRSSARACGGIPMWTAIINFSCSFVISYCLTESSFTIHMETSSAKMIANTAQAFNFLTRIQVYSYSWLQCEFVLKYCSELHLCIFQAPLPKNAIKIRNKIGPFGHCSSTLSLI